MTPASMTFVRPALRDYRAAIVAAAHHCPGGRAPREDLEGIRLPVARAHRITPDDLQRWYDALSREELHVLTAEVA